MSTKKVHFSENESTKVIPKKDTIADIKKNQREAEDFMVDMINNFTMHYKKVNCKKEDFTLLDGINFFDLTSTNAPLEKLYEEMLKFKINEQSNPSYINIHKYSERDCMHIDDELYGIIKNGEPVYLCTSFFSLLIELTNLKNEGLTNDKNVYDIVSLK